MNQRRSGHNWEREVVKDLADLFGLTSEEIGTTRENSRKMDARGLDIWFKDSIGVDIQCKEKTTNSETLIPLEASYIDMMKTDNKKILAFKTYRKRRGDKRRKVTGRFAVVEWEFFLHLLSLYEDLYNSMEHE